MGWIGTGERPLRVDVIEPGQLSWELRRGEGPELAGRRVVVGASVVAAACMGLIGLYQVGIVRHLPDLPLPGFDADRVDASEQAYGRLSTPDGFLGLVSYALTATLAAAGGARRAERRPWLSLLFAGKVLADAGQAAVLTREQWTKQRALCVWCLVASGATFAALPFALREGRTALRSLR